MIRNLCIPLTLKILGLGRPLHNAERLAAAMIVWVVLLCALMGFTLRLPAAEDEPGNQSGSHALGRGIVPVTYCGIFPGIPGTGPGPSRSFLHMQ